MFIENVSQIPKGYNFKLWNNVFNDLETVNDLYRYGSDSRDIVNSYKKFITDSGSNFLRISARIFNPFEYLKLNTFHWDDIEYTFRVYFELIYEFKNSKNKQKLQMIESHKNRIFSIINDIKVNLYNIDKLYSPELLLKYCNINDYKIVANEVSRYSDSDSYIAWKIEGNVLYTCGFSWDFNKIQINVAPRKYDVDEFRTKYFKQIIEITKIEFPEELL